jgi:hypothetical protein
MFDIAPYQLEENNTFLLESKWGMGDSFSHFIGLKLDITE